MRKFVLGAIAAVILGLGFVASNASAAWVTRTAYRWDPLCGRYVAVGERVWVPDYSYYDGPRYPVYRPWYLPSFSYGDRHEHHHHDHHR